MLHSAILNVMLKAARRAGRSLKRDLGEVENLQVSLKGPRNFVTAADRRAEEIVYEELSKARPEYGFLGEEGGARAGADKTPSLDRRSARRHHQLPARHSALRGLHRARAERRHRRGADLQSGKRGSVRRRTRQGRVPQRPAYPRRRPAAARGRRGGLRSAALRPRRPRARTPRNRCRPKSLRRAPPISAPPPSTSPGSPPAASTLSGSATCRRGIWPRASCWCARPAVLSPISTAAKKC